MAQPTFAQFYPAQASGNGATAVDTHNKILQVLAVLASGQNPDGTNFTLRGTSPAGTSYSHIATAATTTAKSGAGVLHSITVNTKSVGGTATVYDNTAGSGTVIGVIDTTVGTGTLVYNLTFATGLTVVTADGGATHADLTVVYE